MSLWTCQVALLVKNPLANARDIRDLGPIPGSAGSPGERKPKDEEPGWLPSIGSQRVGHN